LYSPFHRWQPSEHQDLRVSRRCWICLPFPLPLSVLSISSSPSRFSLSFPSTFHRRQHEGVWSRFYGVPFAALLLVSLGHPFELKVLHPNFGRIQHAVLLSKHDYNFNLL
jgi:hypothetical protein